MTAQVMKTTNEDPAEEFIASEIDMKIVRKHLDRFEKESLDRLMLRDAGEDIDEWITGPSKKDVHVFYSPVKDSEWYTIKSVIKVNATVDKAVEILSDPEQVPLFDEMTSHVEILERIGSETQVRLVSAKSVMFTKARDFCVATTVHRHSDGRVLIATRSVDHPDARNRDGYVRALSIISGYIVTPMEGGCQVTVIAHMDLGGYIPGAVMRFLGLSAPMKLLLKFQELAEQQQDNN